MHPCAPMQVTATAQGAALTEGDLALQHLRSMLPTPGEKAALQANPHSNPHPHPSPSPKPEP